MGGWRWVPIAINGCHAPAPGTQRKTGRLGLKDRDCLSRGGHRLQLAWATFLTKKWPVGGVLAHEPAMQRKAAKLMGQILGQSAAKGGTMAVIG